MSELLERLKISGKILDELNGFLLDPGNDLIDGLLRIVDKYGGPDAINKKADQAGRLETLLDRLREKRSPYLNDLKWLEEQRDAGAFISKRSWLEKILGGRAPEMSLDVRKAVTLEISALQFFPWLISEAKQAIGEQELMPGRFIRVRNMQEQVEDDDILAVAAGMKIVGASWVETLDTKGTDGSNVHLGGPETITGYFGGVGQPNEHALKWIEEYLYYYTEYGVRQVLNVNPGTILLGYLLYRLGVDNEFKISVFTGNDNPYSVLWTLVAAKLFSRDDGSTSLRGLNFSNSINVDTLLACDSIRRQLGLDDQVRFEHHITEAYKHIVRQPYLRRDELLEAAAGIANISAKHEGGDPEDEAVREHPSDILDYFLPKEEILEQGLMPALERNYLDKHLALNRTAAALARAGIDCVCARKLHE